MIRLKLALCSKIVPILLLTLPYLTRYRNLEGHLACWVLITSISVHKDDHGILSEWDVKADGTPVSVESGFELVE